MPMPLSMNSTTLGEKRCPVNCVIRKETMKTIHFIYPHGNRISAPDSIGRNLGMRLEDRYQVLYYDLNSKVSIKPNPGDVLLGHPMPALWTCFRKSLRQPGWERVLAMSPYNHDLFQVSFYDSFIEKCDLYLAITGNYWFGSIDDSPYYYWAPKMRHLDLAVDRIDFPTIKTSFNSEGKRRFVYIGGNIWCKNTNYLSEIARRMPDTSFSWIGKVGLRKIGGLNQLGYQDFSTAEGKRVVGSQDFMITVGNADANPTTILEAMAWGLIPVCTEQSGYTGYPGIVNIPLDDSQSAVEILGKLQTLPEGKLREMQQQNWLALDKHFNWDRFADQVIEAIESDACPSLKPVSPFHKFRIRLAALTSPYSPLHPKKLVKFFYRSLRKVFAND